MSVEHSSKGDSGFNELGHRVLCNKCTIINGHDPRRTEARICGVSRDYSEVIIVIIM